MVVIICFIISVLFTLKFLYDHYKIKEQILIGFYKNVLDYHFIYHFHDLIEFIDILHDLRYAEIEGLSYLNIINNKSKDFIIYRSAKYNFIKYKIISTGVDNLPQMMVHPRLNTYLDEIFSQLRLREINI